MGRIVPKENAMVHTVLRIAMWSGACLLAVLMAVESPTWAASFKMGVVDPQAVLERSKAGQRALAELKKYAEARQKILAEDEGELKKMQEEIQNGGGDLSEEDRRTKQLKFREKLQSYQQRAQAFNDELGQKQQELVDEYMEKISDATRVVAQKRGLSLVMDKGSDTTLKIVIYNKKSIDVTDQVVEEFDRRYK